LLVLYCCKEGYLESGDYLVVDNAPVHSSLESYEVLKLILETFNVNLKKTPVYSPELNACEFVFQLLKSDLRNNRGEKRIMDEVINSISKITREKVRKEYYKAIYPKFILPDYNL